jgi:hypothetical protein
VSHSVKNACPFSALRLHVFAHALLLLLERFALYPKLLGRVLSKIGACAEDVGAAMGAAVVLKLAVAAGDAAAIPQFRVRLLVSGVRGCAAAGRSGGSVVTGALFSDPCKSPLAAPGAAHA